MFLCFELLDGSEEFFDAGATPLDAAFQLTPDLRPYDVERPRVSTDAMTQ